MIDVALTEQRTRETVAVVIPTYNVEGIIDRCLRSVQWADEIIIVDMFSTDTTVDICKSYPNVRVFQRRDYIFGNVNFGMDQATTDWVIRLDSDEVPNGDLQASIQSVLADPDPAVAGYSFPSIQYMLGHPMRYGVGLPALNIRKCMFRRGTARYECKSEHEDISASAEFRVLNGYYEHFTNQTVSEFIQKADYYVAKDIERLSPSEIRPPKVSELLYRSIRMFLLYYIQWKGYKDGYLGLFSSFLRGPLYVFLDAAKRWELWSAESGRSGLGLE